MGAESNPDRKVMAQKIYDEVNRSISKTFDGPSEQQLVAIVEVLLDEVYERGLMAGKTSGWRAACRKVQSIPLIQQSRLLPDVLKFLEENPEG